MKRLKILEKKMTGYELREALQKHKRWSLPQPKDLKHLDDECCWVQIKEITKGCKDGLCYNPKRDSLYESNLLFKNKAVVFVNEPYWFYKLRTFLGL